MAKKPRQDGEQIIIKKYANRRLYNTDSSSYVTLDDLAQMVKNNDDFAVKDAKSGQDITHSVLTQIILEEENKGETLLPVNFLRQLITFYGDGLQKLVPGYLENSMTSFSRNQDKFRNFIESNLQNQGFEMKSLKPFEEMVKQNMAVFEQTMTMFSPFGTNRANEDMAGKPAADRTTGPEQNSPQGPDSGEDKLADLQTQLARMQAQINNLQKNK